MPIFSLSGILLIFLIVKIYKKRALFKQFSKKEWCQFTSVFLCAWAAAIIVIIGGARLTNGLQDGWINELLTIAIIVIGLVLSGLIINRYMPEKGKDFFS